MAILNEKMINFKEACEIVGIVPSNENAKILKKNLKKYNNKYSKTKIYKLSDILRILDNFESVNG